MFAYTVTIRRNRELVAILYPRSRSEALDMLSDAEDYAAQDTNNTEPYTVTFTATEK